MKTLKMGILALLMVIGNFVFAQQQEGKKVEERATAHTKKITQQLGLTADQEKRVYTLCLQRAKQMDADRVKYQGDKEGMKNARKQNNQVFETSLQQLLTADQKVKYEQFKKDQQAKRQQS